MRATLSKARNAGPAGAAQNAIIRSVVVVACGALFFGACSSSESGPPVPIDDLARLLADAICNNIAPCCHEAGLPHDPVQCHATAENQLGSEIDENRSANVIYDAQAARACVDAYTAMAKACYDDRQVEMACRGVFTGALQPGQPCTQSEECSPGASCQRAADGGASQCTGSPVPRGKLGDRCRGTCTETNGSRSCSGGFSGSTPAGPAECYTNDGLYCDDANTCAVQSVVTEACTTTTACAGEAFCDNGVCAAKRVSGSCGAVGDGCAATAYCDRTSGECQLRKATGEACTSSGECAITDRCDGTCRKRTIASARSCMGDL
jgi:hypothetical protein